jgi:hypothetical protein
METIKHQSKHGIYFQDLPLMTSCHKTQSILIQNCLSKILLFFLVIKVKRKMVLVNMELED